MHAVVTSLTFNDRAAAEAELSEIVSRVSTMPGFVSGYWVALGGDRGSSIIVFDSLRAAETLASFAEGAPYTTVTPREICVGEVIGQAGHPSTAASQPSAEQREGTET
jgi:hypothetical protein